MFIARERRDKRRELARARSSPAPRPFDFAIVAAALLLMVLLPISGRARAGVVSEDVSAGAVSGAYPDASSTSTAARTPLRYQLRCFQYGQLVIDEPNLELPADGPYAVAQSLPSTPVGNVRLRANDRQHQPIYLTETHNATCLMRPMRTDLGAK